MRKFQDLLARVFDVALVLAGATVASRIRFENLAQSGFYWVLVMFSAAFAMSFPQRPIQPPSMFKTAPLR